MFALKSKHRIINNCMISIAMLLLSSCYVDSRGRDRMTIDLKQVAFEPDLLSMSTSPNKEILDDDRNPFANWQDTSQKWSIYAWVLEDVSERAMVGFYVWASALALEATGENQYYVGLALEDLLVQVELSEADAELVRQALYASHQTVLLLFPDSLSYSATGQPIHLASLSYQKLKSFDAPIPEGWILIDTPDGPRAVDTSKL